MNTNQSGLRRTSQITNKAFDILSVLVGETLPLPDPPCYSRQLTCFCLVFDIECHLSSEQSFRRQDNQNVSALALFANPRLQSPQHDLEKLVIAEGWRGRRDMGKGDYQNVVWDRWRMDGECRIENG